ncbi:MAG TPA: TlpA disulfide reductase family protein [Vicinamibacterales bacterium]
MTAKTRHSSLLAACAAASLFAATPLDAQGSKTVRVSVQPEQQRMLAPEFSLKDATGNTVRLSAYRGHVVLLDFWATACGGCVEEIPAFVEITQAYSGKGLATVGVSEDIVYEDLKGPEEAWSRVKPFVRDHKMRYAVLMGDEQVTAVYGIKALPVTYLLDTRGRIAATYVGVVDRANLEANINLLLSEVKK